MLIVLPAEVQKRAAAALQQGRDILIQSQTGSGKTLAFLLPLLSVLKYPPEVYPDDLKVLHHQSILVYVNNIVTNRFWQDTGFPAALAVSAQVPTRGLPR